MTHLRHWQSTAASFSPCQNTCFSLLVSAGSMLLSELGNWYAATRVYHAGGGTAAALGACDARAAAGHRQGPLAQFYESMRCALARIDVDDWLRVAAKRAEREAR